MEMEGIEPYINIFLALPSPRTKLDKQKKAQLERLSLFVGGAYPIRTGVHGFADR